jgi:hypothetical protein
MKSPPPGKLIVGYASWAECDDKVLQAARSGVNVIVWFAINLAISNASVPAISGGPSLSCVRDVRAALEREGLETFHMISIGGWNAPHPPDRAFSVDAWWHAFTSWNQRPMGKDGGGARLFDGIDWDLEGSDAAEAQGDGHVSANTLSVPCLELIGELSIRASRDGLLVSLAPPQSYLSSATGEFNRTALQPPLGNWPRPPGSAFRYAGRNSYAYLLARYGAHTFDWVFVQLYESYSLAHAQLLAGSSLTDVLVELLGGYSAGWKVQFASDPAVGIDDSQVQLEPSVSVVVGLANGWADASERRSRASPWARAAVGGQALFLCPAQIRRAYAAIPHKIRPRGFGFWSIADEGASTRCPREDGSAGEQLSEPLYLARALNEILHVRAPSY